MTRLTKYDELGSSPMSSLTNPVGLEITEPGPLEKRSPVTSTRASRPDRISALDFTKGSLVVIMVLYHWLNYFVGPEGSFYRYLGFLPPSFICITGFLVSYVYLSKYQLTNRQLPRRLAIRGFKILMIFVVLNALIRLITPAADGGRTFVDLFSPATLWKVYVSGNLGSGRNVAFYVLVPISYLLLLSAALLPGSRYIKQIFHFATISALAGIVILGVVGEKSQNLELLFIGLLGITVGYVPIRTLNKCLDHPYAVVTGYLLYLIAITIWNVRYPLQVAGVLLTLAVLYLIGTASGEVHRIPATLVLLGKYSLFGYIAQIALLQILRRSLGGYLANWSLVLSFFLAVGLTVTSVEVVHRVRAGVPAANRLYEAIFS